MDASAFNIDIALDELKNAIQSLLVDAARIAAEERSESHVCAKCESTDLYAWKARDGDRYYKNVPTLTIYIRTVNNYNFFCFINWVLCDSVTNAIRKTWKEILRGHEEMAAYYDDAMLIRIYNDVERRLVDAVYQNRDLITSQIKNMPVVEPEEIYRRSEPPGYRIIYATQDDYKAAESNKEFDAIKSEVIKLIEENMSTISYQEIVDMLDISFWHPEMQYFSGYGFARED